MTTISALSTKFDFDAFFAPLPDSLKCNAENGTTHLKLLEVQAQLLVEHLTLTHSVDLTPAQALEAVSCTYGFTDYGHAHAQLSGLARPAEVKIGKVIRKRFQTTDAYVQFAFSGLAPRYSTEFPEDSSNMCETLLATLGLQKDEALFSDDIVELQRALLNWDQNNYEITEAKAEDDPDYAPNAGWVDKWVLKAGPAVPPWYLFEFFGELTNDLRKDAALLQKTVLRELFDNSSFCVWDKQNNRHREIWKNVTSLAQGS